MIITIIKKCETIFYLSLNPIRIYVSVGGVHITSTVENS